MAFFRIHPKSLADILANSVDIGKDKTTHPLIFLRALGDTLHAYGRGRYAAGTDSRPFESDGPQYGEIVITEDEASELATALRGVEGAGRKETVVGVKIDERSKFMVESGEDILCELPDADPEQATFGMPDEVSDWEEIDELIAAVVNAQQASLTAPLAFQKEALVRMNKIRADSNVLDICNHPSGRLVGIALGSTFRAVIAGVDREKYANGGKWGDGPGKPDDLWEGIP